VLIRRTKLGVDLRALPIDGFDMFLLTRIEGSSGPMSFQELVAMTPRAPLDTLQRVEQLARLGLLMVEGESPPALCADGAHALTPGEDIITLKPPPKRVSFDDAQTLRPPRPGKTRAPVSVEILSPSGSASRGSAPGAGSRFRAR
jgi:hypothetical protein